MLGCSVVRILPVALVAAKHGAGMVGSAVVDDTPGLIEGGGIMLMIPAPAQYSGGAQLAEDLCH